MPKAEVTSLAYEPGQTPDDLFPRTPPADPGDYSLQLTNFGAKGAPGWKRKNNGYPYRMLVFDILGTEDENTGNPKKHREVLTMHPKGLFRVTTLAAASQFPERLSLVPVEDPSDPAMLALIAQVDEILERIVDEDIILDARLKHEEYNGSMQTRIAKYLTPGTVSAAASAPVEAEEEEAEVIEEEVPAVKPVKAAALKGAAKVVEKAKAKVVGKKK